MYKPDPNNPNVRAASELIGRIIWQYVNTHTAEECEALQRKVDRDREIRRRMVNPVPVESDERPA